MKLFFLLLLFFVTFPLFAQYSGQRVMFYNVENLFDTQDDPKTQDDEFTPQGVKYWTRDRYVQKLLRLAEVVDSVGQGAFPVLVGMAEVENRKVLEDLIGKTVLAEGNYGIVHQDSPDGRGIDVALLYRKDLWQLLYHEFLSIPFPEDSTLRTREIVYAKGETAGDTLHVFVCHFPSMIGGEQQSEWKRVRAAAVVRQKIDSLFGLDAAAKIIIMGDLNGKANTQAQKTLGTKSSDKKIREGELYNTGYYLLHKNYGSYRYKGRWQTIDHIIVSGGLLIATQGISCERRMQVYMLPFLLEEDKIYFGYKPKPTYRGPRYINGYSDHLPVVLEIK